MRFDFVYCFGTIFGDCQLSFKVSHMDVRRDQVRLLQSRAAVRWQLSSLSGSPLSEQQGGAARPHYYRVVIPVEQAFPNTGLLSAVSTKLVQ